MRPARLILDENASVGEALLQLAQLGISDAPVSDGEHGYRGSVDVERLTRADPDERILSVIAEDMPAVPREATLDSIAEIFAMERVTWVPVLDDDRRIIGVVGTEDLIGAYQRTLGSNLKSLGSITPDSILVEEEVGVHADVNGVTIANAEWPSGTVVIAIQRGDQLVLSEPSTTVRAGDVLSMLVPTNAEARVRRAVSGEPPRDEPNEDAPMI